MTKCKSKTPTSKLIITSILLQCLNATSFVGLKSINVEIRANPNFDRFFSRNKPLFKNSKKIREREKRLFAFSNQQATTHSKSLNRVSVLVIILVKSDDR